MVFFVFLHMMRVFYHGAYKPPREFNWVVGVVLLFLTIMLSLHRLPAAVGPDRLLGDHHRHEHGRLRAAVQHAGASCLLLGGLEVGQNTLLRFYVLHIMVLPARRRDLPGRPLLADPEGRRDLRAAVMRDC